MNSFLRMYGSVLRLGACVTAILAFAGCLTTSPETGGTSPTDGVSATANHTAAATNEAPTRLGSSNILRRGDPLTIIFTGVSDPPPRHEERIKEDGKITLPLIGAVDAADKTIGELQQEITKQYVPKYYKRLNVVVNSEMRFFTILGEVRKPDRHQYLGEMTLLKAISAAGDFTDYAKRTKVQVTRANGQKLNINCIKAQNDLKLDIPIYPDDQIFVPRRLF